MITYLTQLTISWMILFLGYYIFLKRETFFKYNRWYLLTGLLLGLVIPLVDWTSLFVHEAESLGHLYVAPVNTQVQQWDIYVSASPDTPIWYRLLVGVYIAGGLFAALKLAKGVREILSLRRDAEITRQEGYDLVLTNHLHMPFSFMNSIYWSAELYDQSSEKERILAHEGKHVSALHSLDILFIELLCVLFWFHPMVYIYRKEIKEVHEYEADAAACVLGNKREYGKLLLNQAQSGLQLALANHFIYSQLKNRFKMMTRKPSTKRAMLKYLIAIPIIGFAALLFSFTSNENGALGTEIISQTDSIPTNQKASNVPPPPIPNIGDIVSMGPEKFMIEPSDIFYVNGEKVGVVTEELIEKYSKEGPWNVTIYKGDEAKRKFGGEVTSGVYSIRKLPPPPPMSEEMKEDIRKNGEIFKVVEQMPRFPGCEDVEGTAREIKTCADKKMLEFLYDNIQYPKAAKEYGIEGNVVVSFVVEKDGSLTNNKILRDVGGGLGEESLRVVELMNSMDQKWTPGVQRGKKVRVQFILPIKFELSKEDKEISNDEKGIASNAYTGEVFKVVEEMPRFPGCEDIEGTARDKKGCADKKMLEFIYKNIKYPALAKENGVEGNIVASFIVEKDGSITDPKIMRDVGAGLGEESIRVIKMMNKLDKRWTPGKQRGQNVRVQFILPVRFELKDNISQDQDKSIVTRELKGDRKIAGQVVDEKGNPLIGVNVMVKGTNSGTATDFNGNFLMNGVNESSVLVFSSNGYETEERSVSGKDAMKTVLRLRAIKVEEVYKGNAVDAMPRFPGCENIRGTEAEKAKCAEVKMLEYIYENIKYPAVARNNNITGQVIISFVVKKDGTIGWARAIKDVGAGLGEEVERIAESMDSQGKWKPAMKNGEPVNFRMTLPVSFHLKNDKISETIEKADRSKMVNPLPDVVVVGFGGAEDLSEVELKKRDGSEANPLIVLDGTKIGRADGQKTLNTIDPSTIESINVLKGESATKKYGNEGSDGVIEITSKIPEMTRGSAKLDLAGFNLYPNPASNQLNVEFEGPTGQYSLEVVDVKGATLLDRDVSINGRANEVLNISLLNSGPYYLLVKTSGKVASKIFVKK
ncbi:TonB family protein [Membranihabitans maritimus]|uniref:TonB family protein n=1 Tax=Membranihabitans maritimus TaxID=2904244 RepID=UPI001F01249D|nr:TonB family protein [Membranihabitans maritimus]